MQISFFKHTGRQLVAVQLLLLFALAISPKQYLHDIFATHKDSSHQCTEATKAHGCVHQAKFSCQVDNLVVQSYFAAHSVQGLTAVSIILPPLIGVSSPMFIENVDRFKESRGPPALL